LNLLTEISLHSYSEPFYKEYSRGQVLMVSVDRWSLRKDAISLLMWSMG
jgi:hypothetical protein